MNTHRTDHSRDAAVMIAREVFAEDCWRVQGKRLTPAALAEIDRLAYEQHPGTSVREQVEDYCGEALA